MGKIWRFLTGEVSYSFPREDAVAVLEKLRQHRVFYNRFCRNEKTCEVTAAFWKKRIMAQLFGEWETPPQVRWHGVPEILRRMSVGELCEVAEQKMPDHYI